MDQGSKIEELEGKMSMMERQVTRCNRSGDFNHFISHHWLPLQSMVFSWIEYPHCSAMEYSFPTPSCAEPLYGGGGPAVISRLWSASSIPPLKPITLPHLTNQGSLWICK